MKKNNNENILDYSFRWYSAFFNIKRLKWILVLNFFPCLVLFLFSFCVHTGRISGSPLPSPFFLYGTAGLTLFYLIWFTILEISQKYRSSREPGERIPSIRILVSIFLFVYMCTPVFLAGIRPVDLSMNAAYAGFCLALTVMFFLSRQEIILLYCFSFILNIIMYFVVRPDDGSPLFLLLSVVLSTGLSLFISLFLYCEREKSFRVLQTGIILKKGNISSLGGRYGLSRREKEVCMLVVKGFSNREISVSLFISELTVKTHLQNIYAKTAVSGKIKLIRLIRAHTVPVEG